MRICPKCNSWKLQAVEYVIRYYRCANCGWMGISLGGQSLQSFRFKQPQFLLRRSSWVYVIFILVFLCGVYLISAAMITPTKNFAFQSFVSLFAEAEKGGTAGEIKSKSVTTEALVIFAPPSHTSPNLSVVSPTDTESISLHQSENIHVVANRDSRLYHLPGMKYYNSILSHHRVIFPSEEAARQAGYHKAPR